MFLRATSRLRVLNALVASTSTAVVPLCSGPETCDEWHEQQPHSLNPVQHTTVKDQQYQ